MHAYTHACTHARVHTHLTEGCQNCYWPWVPKCLTTPLFARVWKSLQLNCSFVNRHLSTRNLCNDVISQFLFTNQSQRQHLYNKEYIYFGEAMGTLRLYMIINTATLGSPQNHNSTYIIHGMHNIFQII